MSACQSVDLRLGDIKPSNFVVDDCRADSDDTSSTSLRLYVIDLAGMVPVSGHTAASDSLLHPLMFATRLARTGTAVMFSE